MAKEKVEEKTFEESLVELESIVKELESGTIYSNSGTGDKISAETAVANLGAVSFTRFIYVLASSNDTERKILSSVVIVSDGSSPSISSFNK